MTTLRSVTLAVTGGIAAYKCCELVRGLKKAGIDVHVAMTEHAAAFVGPITFEALTGHPVALTEWAPGPQGSMPLNRSNDLLIVMPATANIIAKAAHGIADDLVSTMIAARRQPVLFVPAMNRFMWENPANLRNVEQLRRDGALFAGPACGFQACGDVGAGRMVEPSEVLDLLPGLLAPKSLSGRRVVITAGPTFEPIDDVRGITNKSSGLQGYEIARASRDAGAVEEALKANGADVFIGVAAVADWRIATAVSGKMKKTDGRPPELRFEENPDILRTVGTRSDVKLKVGFAAEAENLEAYARGKCISKHARERRSLRACLQAGGCTENRQPHRLHAQFSNLTHSEPCRLTSKSSTNACANACPPTPRPAAQASTSVPFLTSLSSSIPVKPCWCAQASPSTSEIPAMPP